MGKVKVVTLKELKEMAKKVNALKLGKKNLLEAIGVKKLKLKGKFAEMADAFLDAFNEIAEDEAATKKVPKALIAFQHRLYDQVEEEEEEDDGDEEDEEEEDDGDEEDEEEEDDGDDDEEEDDEEEEDEEDDEEEEEEPKKKKKKKGKKKKESKPKKKSTDSAKLDEFGFKVGSNGNLFAKAIKKKAQTMTQLKNADWNEAGSTFYSHYKKLVEDGHASRTDDMKMYIIGSKAEPKKAKKKKGKKKKKK